MKTGRFRSRLSLLLAATLMAGGASTAAAQHGGSGPGGHESAPAHPGHQKAQACADEFDAVVGEGRGFGLGFAADRNGYPGPMHVLELKERLNLTPEQETKARGLLEAMFAESRPKSARLLAAEARLNGVFAGGGADEKSVRAAVADVERARADVRLVHLLAHVRTRALLTDVQVRAYHEARWGAAQKK